MVAYTVDHEYSNYPNQSIFGVTRDDYSFYFRGKQVTVEAFMYGITMALFIAIILVIFISFNIILNGNRFLYIFSKFLPRIALMIMMAIRFVPLMKRRLDEIGDVQRLRGMSMTVGSLKTRVRSGMLRIQILLTWSLEEAVHVSNSMKARGYGSEGKKVPTRLTIWRNVIGFGCLY